MKRIIAAFALLAFASLGFSAAESGKPAPAFSVKDANGKTQQFSDYTGKWLVLEWFNKDCPFVKKHYNSENMQGLQRKYTALATETKKAKKPGTKASKEVAWLTIVSSAKGKQGYLEPAEAQKVLKEKKMASTALLLDTDGKMGKDYGAKTSPHLFVINPQGTVVYAGAIDDNDSADPAVIAKSKNYVSAALDEAMAGKPVTVASTPSYGCGIKY